MTHSHSRTTPRPAPDPAAPGPMKGLGPLPLGGTCPRCGRGTLYQGCFGDWHFRGCSGGDPLCCGPDMSPRPGFVPPTPETETADAKS